MFFYLYIKGVVAAGVGLSALNTVLSCLDVPSINPNLYRKYEQEVGAALEAAAKSSCARAVQEERELVCKKLHEFVAEL